MDGWLDGCMSEWITCGRIWTSITSCCSSLSSGRLTVVSQVVFNRAAPDTLELKIRIYTSVTQAGNCVMRDGQANEYELNSQCRAGHCPSDEEGRENVVGRYDELEYIEPARAKQQLYIYQMRIRFRMIRN